MKQTRRMKTFLITGAQGQLGREFTLRLRNMGLNVIALSRSDLDITDRDRVMEVVRWHAPDVVINCAAYNNVDGAESDQETAFAVNADGPGNLAAAAKNCGAIMVHYGTDYVFDGKNSKPYIEDDDPNPISLYGQSKLEGELQVENKANAYLIFRVSWVFGPGTSNFFYRTLEWSQSRDALKIVTDQVSCPTYTATIVSTTLAALEKGLHGLYHLTSSGSCSRFGMTRHFFETIGSSTRVEPALTAHFPAPAKRPTFSALSNERICLALGTGIPRWTEEVDAYIERFYDGSKLDFDRESL